MHFTQKNSMIISKKIFRCPSEVLHIFNISSATNQYRTVSFPFHADKTCCMDGRFDVIMRVFLNNDRQWIEEKEGDI